MSESPHSTHTGALAVTAVTLFALIHVGQFIATARSDLAAMAVDQAFQCSVMPTPHLEARGAAGYR
jgi:hypothetical protein